MKIQDDIIKILSECTIEGSTVFLPKTQLDRKTYMAVNKHLENLGGKWNRKAKGHVFDDDPTDSFENMLLTGETTDFKKEFQFFETPPELAKKMVEMAELKDSDFILEPSAGMGGIAKFIKPDNLICNELNPKMFEALKKELKCNFLAPVDFLTVSKLKPDKILQNPPFHKQFDISHILHAYSLLKEGGILVSVVSESPFFRENKKSVEFREFLNSVGAEIIINPEGTFKASGTMVRTRLIKIVKDKNCQ